MCVHTVIRCTSNRRQIETTLSPFARAVRIASTWLSVRGVLARLLGFATASVLASAASCDSSSIPSFACSHAVPSRSNLCQVFGLSPPASTVSKSTSGLSFPPGSKKPVRPVRHPRLLCGGPAWGPRSPHDRPPVGTPAGGHPQPAGPSGCAPAASRQNRRDTHPTNDAMRAFGSP